MTSPKQPTAKSNRDWYPYYAGFTKEFVERTLTTALNGAQSVVDPWSGSGTTTAACAQNGVSSVGVDINPVLTVIARARLAPAATRDSLNPMARNIMEAAREAKCKVDEQDLITRWIRPGAASRVRAIQYAIHHLLTEEIAHSPRGAPDPYLLAKQLPVLASFFYSALFSAVRDVLAPFRTSNPMWLKEPATYRHRIAPGWSTLSNAFLERVQFLRDRLHLEGDEPEIDRHQFLTGSATELPFENSRFGAALTSPPYATRLDYVKGMIPELIVLGVTDEHIAELRRRTTGTPVVSGVSQQPIEELWSPTGKALVDEISNHPSKGSERYYGPWMRNYLFGLQAGLREIARVVVDRGPIAIVVQDSYYKSRHVDLQTIVAEIMESSNRSLSERQDYEAKNLRSKQNPNARKHLPSRTNSESVMVFQ